MITCVRVAVCVLVLYFTAASHASAKDCEDPEGSGLWADCMAVKALDAAESKLNVAYKNLITELQKNKYVQEAKSLKAAQRLWIDYRQQYCTVVGKLKGGSPDWEASYFTNCMAELAAGRGAELEQLRKHIFE